MIEALPILSAVLCGVIIGLVTGLLGGGGSILSVPLLLYVVGLPSAHMAIGTSAVAVSLTSLGSLFFHARGENVDWGIAGRFGIIGICGALLGAAVAKNVDGTHLVLVLGCLMIAVAVTTVLRRNGQAATATVPARSRTPLFAGGFATGALSGFFGVSAGFLIVPALRFITGMPAYRAIGTSLAVSSFFAGAIAVSYGASGLVDWTIAAAVVAGGVFGALIGWSFGERLSLHTGRLDILFGVAVGSVGVYVLVREGAGIVF